MERHYTRLHDSWNPDFMKEPRVLRSAEEEVLTRLSNNKAAGVDGIPGELLKGGGNTKVDFMTKLCNLILNTEK